MMRVMQLTRKNFASAVLLGLIAIILSARLQLTINRYVDQDEFAYLHWTYLVSRGLTPYKDFFMNFTPLFSWLARPLFLPQPSGNLITLARIWQFIWYFFAALLVYKITVVVSKKKLIGFWATLIFLVFPMTLDKSLEFRPDTVMTVLFLFGLYLLLADRELAPKTIFLSGLIFGTSLAILPKIIYGGAALFYLLVNKKQSHKNLSLFWLGLGSCLPIAILVIYLNLQKILPLAWINIVDGSYFIKQGEGAFSLARVFEPFPLVYLPGAGASWPWLVNTVFCAAVPLGLVILGKKNFPGAEDQAAEKNSFGCQLSVSQ